MQITQYHAKYFAHCLMRKHSVIDPEKLAVALSDAQVDLNPHQLDAALFAFRSPLSKGAILADEVGLGKTIEAGLVISQKWAEGKRRILVITPANLRKQWAQEINDKFYLPAFILETKNYNQLKKERIKRPFEQNTLILCSYQFAAKHSEEIMLTQWDLVVIDEAHRLRNVYKPDNKIGRALKTALINSPKLLLTATPLQNSLMELYGLVSIIDDYAFGDAKSFRSQYARITGDACFDELKARLSPLCHRTLRRQVLEYISFTNRIPITEDFIPSDDELVLYDMVSDYLRRANLYALPNSQRQLITLILRKLLASSTFAIAGALDSLARRLKGILKKNEARIKLLEAIQVDFEEYEEYADEWGESDEEEILNATDINAIEHEIAELETLRDISVSITENAKGNALLAALKSGFSKAKELGSLEKALVFTESRRTQDYLIRLLSENGYSGKIVLFNGSNNDPRAKEIYAKWFEANKNTDRVSGSKSADTRAALVEYFQKQAQIMIATEAGAEGINLQFCSIVVNYDLPWNPQRIEQRIGRCHRYGQKYDVVVINFLNRKNEADQRVFELLAEKFKLFSGVFGASDEILGVIESGIEFEKRIASIYQNCRTSEEIEDEFARLREEMDTQISATMEDTRKKLLENFDSEVHDRLKVSLQESREYLNKYDSMLWTLSRHELSDLAQFFPHSLRFVLHHTDGLGVTIPTGEYALSKEPGNAHRYRLGHPLAKALITRAAQRRLKVGNIEFNYTEWDQKAAQLVPLVGENGWLTVAKLSVTGADAQDHLILAGLTSKGKKLPSEVIQRFFALPARLIPQNGVIPKNSLAQETERHKKIISNCLVQQQANWFEIEIEKLNAWADDRRKGLKNELKDYDDEIALLKKEARLAVNLPEKLAVQKKIRDLDKKRDTAWRSYDEASKEIEKQKDELLDQVEARLEQKMEEETLFTLQWKII